jgi:hypothetical protein
MKTKKNEEVTTSAPTENVETKEVFTDRHEKPIAIESRVNCRIGGSWFTGSIVKFKIIDDEQYVHVLLDGRDTTKMFHSTDVDKIEDTTTSKREKLDALLKKTAEAPTTPLVPVVKKAPVKKIKKVPVVEEVVVDPIVPEESIVEVESPIETPEIDLIPAEETTPEVGDPTLDPDLTDTVVDLESNKAFKPAKAVRPTEYKKKPVATLDPVIGAPKPGSKSEKILQLLQEGKTKAEVAKLTGSIYQFVHTIAKKYFRPE